MWLFWLHNNTDIHLDLRQIECYFITWHPISMRAGPAVLRFDLSRAGLGMDLPVFVYRIPAV